MKKYIAFFLAIVLTISAFSGCHAGTDNNAKLNIVTSVFPLYDWTANIIDGVDGINLSMLVKNGTDLHSYQPSAADLITISECDVFIYVGGESDEWASDTISRYAKEGCVIINLMDVLGDSAKKEEIQEGMEPADEDDAYDEHVWLSINNAITFTEKIASELEKKDSGNSETYSANTSKYVKQLLELDLEYCQLVNNASCKTLLFADRFPFRYLVDDYGLSYYAAFAGCSAETEASFSTVTFLAGKADELNLPAVLVIDGSDTKLAGTVVSNTKNKNLPVLKLDSMQTVSSLDVKKGTGYISIMEKNLEVLKSALKYREPEPTATEGVSPTTNPNFTAAPTATAVPSITEPVKPTATPTVGGTEATASPTEPAKPTVTPTAGGTATTEPTATPTATTKPTPTEIVKPTATPTAGGTEPTAGPTETAKPTATPAGNTATPTATTKPTPTATAAPTATPTATAKPEATDTPAPTATNTPVPTATATPVPTSTPTPVASFVWTDRTLENAIRSAIGKSTGTVTENDIKSITSLNLRGKGISSVADLAKFTGLKSLYLDDNNISDISALAALTGLETLTIGYNTISDISGLSRLTNLTCLCVNNNSITDISAIASLKKLRELNLEYNTITAVTALSGLNSLSILRLTGNNISSVTALSGIAPGLDSLWLGFNKITSISALNGLKASAVLNLADNDIADWSPVAHVKSVTGRP